MGGVIVFIGGKINGSKKYELKAVTRNEPKPYQDSAKDIILILIKYSKEGGKDESWRDIARLPY